MIAIARPTKNNQSLLAGVRLVLLLGVTKRVQAVGEGTGQTETGQPGQAPGPAQGTESLLGLRGRGGRGRGSSIGVAAASDPRHRLGIVGPERLRAEDLRGSRDGATRRGRQLHQGRGEHGAHC